MNERIRELALQAQTDGDAIHYYSPAFAEKFAELIVRECAGLLEKEAEGGHDEGTASYNVLLTMSKWMKQYFGVEE